MLDQDRVELVAKLNGSFLLFIRTFFELIEGKPFIIPNPIDRENHIVIICRALTQAFRLEIPNHRLMINVPPGHFKSTLLIYWVAWCMSQYPDSNFIYVSYSATLAAEHTSKIRQIMMSDFYTELFEVRLQKDSQAKDFFKTMSGGAVFAAGSAGSITGRNAGSPGAVDKDGKPRFSGALVIDDPLKPDDVFSDTIRENVNDNYGNTLNQRPRGIYVPRILLMQRLGEGDLSDKLQQKMDGYDWHLVSLAGEDEEGNALYPEEYPTSWHNMMKEKFPYVWNAQIQQRPQPAGGALFKENWFHLHDRDPDIVLSFITADTAESSKTTADATVFSFWGLYKVKTLGVETGQFALHWLDCWEERIEPKDLKAEFLYFWQKCLMYKIQPKFAAIEKKSTGVTLISVLQEIQGIQIREIERNADGFSKTARFSHIQPYLAERKISFTKGAKHTEKCITHMGKITNNNTHANDDIADTCVDACYFAFIRKEFDYLINSYKPTPIPTYHKSYFT